MPKIQCNYEDCGFLDEGFCTAALVEIDPDKGCITYVPTADSIVEEPWDGDDEDELEEWGDLSSIDEDEDEVDDWLEEDEY